MSQYLNSYPLNSNDESTCIQPRFRCSLEWAVSVIKHITFTSHEWYGVLNHWQLEYFFNSFFRLPINIKAVHLWGEPTAHKGIAFRVASPCHGVFVRLSVTLIPAWISQYIHSGTSWSIIMCEMKLLMHSQTSTLVTLSLGMDKWFHLILYQACNYISVLGLKLTTYKYWNWCRCIQRRDFAGLF